MLLDAERGNLRITRRLDAPHATRECHPTGVELVVTIRVDAQRGDSVRTRIELIDPLAAPSLMHRVVSGKPLPRPEAVREARDLSMVAMTTLTQMSRAPRGGMGVMAETPSAPAPPRP